MRSEFIDQIPREPDFSKFVKHDEGKPPLALLIRIRRVLEMVAYVFKMGDTKYRPDNWKECKEPERFLDAAFRHLFKGVMSKDPESKLLHGAHAIASLSYYMELVLGIESETSKVTAPP